MMSISIHDNDLLSYMVDCRQKEIRLVTEFHADERHEWTDVIFSGVVAYHFETDVFGTIICDINEMPLIEIMVAYENLFIAGRNYGWPGIAGLFKTTSTSDMMALLEALEIKAFVISPAIGLSGFVLANAMTLVPGQ